MHLTAATAGGYLFTFKVVVFGSVSAPTVWGRFAAWLGRSTAATTHTLGLRMHIYVGDPIYIAVGSRAQRERAFTVALLLAAVAGFPIA